MLSRLTMAFLLLIAAFCLLTVTHSQEAERLEEEDVETRRLRGELHPIAKVFNPSELRTFRDADAVAITPLKLESKLSKAWLSGREEAIKQLAKRATRRDGGVDAESILKKNEENELYLTSQQLKHQVAMAYLLGSLNAVNRLHKATGVRRLPAMRRVSRDEIRSRQQQFIKMLTERQRLKAEGKEVEKDEDAEMETNQFWGGRSGGFGYGGRYGGWSRSRWGNDGGWSRRSYGGYGGRWGYGRGGGWRHGGGGGRWRYGGGGGWRGGWSGGRRWGSRGGW